MPHVVLTGGTGLVGRSITKILLENNYRVTQLSRSRPLQSPSNLLFQWVETDLRADAISVLRDLLDVDFVVHCAASIRDDFDSISLDRILETNIIGTRNLLKWSGDCGIRKFIFISSLSVLRRPLETPITEKHPVGPNSPYSMSKLWAEENLLRQAAEFCFTPVILRISSPIPSSFAELPGAVVRKMLQCAIDGQPLKVYGRGTRAQDFVLCSDIATAVLKSIETGTVRGVYNIGSGEALSMIELAKLIANRSRSCIVFERSEGSDGDVFELCIDKARNDFGYSPQLSGREAIDLIARSIFENCGIE